MKPSSRSPLSRWMMRLERSSRVDWAVLRCEPVLEWLHRHRSVTETLQGRHLGHAVHPIMVQVPLGTWLSALMLDLSPVDREGRAAQLLSGIGLLSALPAVVTGVAELAEADQPRRRVGTVHAGANTLGLLLQSVALVQRSRGHQKAALMVSTVAMVALGAGGYLGGHLSIARKVGSRDPLFEDDQCVEDDGAQRPATPESAPLS